MSFGSEIADEAGKQAGRIIAAVAIVALLIGAAIGYFAA